MLEPTTEPTQQPTPEPMRRRLDDGGEGSRGETKASSSSSLLSNKFGARTIRTTPLTNAQANTQANSTTNWIARGGSVILIIGAGTDLDVTSLLIENFIFTNNSYVALE
jgi:hypothetical protein